jgi:hypothetical protein
LALPSTTIRTQASKGRQNPYLIMHIDIRHKAIIQTPGLKRHRRHALFYSGPPYRLERSCYIRPTPNIKRAEHLANLKEAVSTNTPNLAQQKLEAELQSVIKNLDTLVTTQQTNAHNVAAYNMFTRSSFPHHTNNI